MDKLSEIGNVNELFSARRSAGVRGALVAQDVYQLRESYGDMAWSLWSN